MKRHPGLLRLAAATAIGYTLGSVLSAELVSQVARVKGKTTDLRSVGSGNPGAANAMTALGKGWGAAVLAGDVAKGGTASLLGSMVAGGKGAYLAGTAAVIGHCFPLFHRFRGGKGVATSLGTSLVCFPLYVPIDVTVAAAGWAGSRQAARATLLASGIFVGATWLWYRRQWPNGWGPRPTILLPLYATVTSAVIAYRFMVTPRLPPQAEVPESFDEVVEVLD
jgi:acyl phosphate:glycerol-3-phosphate acyltransferase